jgi:hypothetical protein
MIRKWLLLAILPVLLPGCPREEGLTASEARQAVEETSWSTQAEGLSAASIDISTNFTIGQAVEAAAQELHNFIVSQLPCADVTLSGATLRIQYGVHPGNCTYRGHILVSQDEQSQVVVDHTWDHLSNGRIELNGHATVTWNFSQPSRHIVHTANWTNLVTGQTATGTGDRTQTLLTGGLAEGFREDGSRTWTGNSGEWDLGIDGVEMRWVDPVPQSGIYTLSTPFNKSASMSFSRQDADTILVTVTSGKRSFSFTVSSLGIRSQT